MINYKLEVLDNEDIRIDKYVSIKLGDYSRSFFKDLFNEKKILLNGKVAKPSNKVSIGDLISVELPKEKEIEVLPEDVKLDIVYEDDYLAIINKPSNMTVHPTETNLESTLVNAILNKFEHLSDIYLPFRPGIVHRLDKDTTGLIIIAKDNETHKKLEEMFKERLVKKTYIAIVNGEINQEMFLSYPIGRDLKDRKKMNVRIDSGKEAITRIFPVSSNEKYSLVKVNIDTGRTHQIRVHFKYIHHNIVGDKTYGIRNEKVNFKSQLLHALKLEFIHPISGKGVSVTAKPSVVFKNAITKLQIPVNEFIEENVL